MLRFLVITVAIAAATCLPAGTIAAEPSAWMDAAEVFLDGTEMDGFAAVRLFATAGDADMTNVRFQIVVHSGILHNCGQWTFDDPTCPWRLAEPARIPVGDGTFWTTGLVYYPHTREFAPIFQHGDADVTYEIRDTVPAGFTWDVAIKLEGLDGSDIELFSTAEGDLASDGWSAVLTDSDRSPQSAPEPTTVALLASGASLLSLRRRG